MEWFRWGEWKSESNLYRSRMHDFVRDLIQFRKDNAHAFAPTEHGGGMPFAWKNPSNYDMSDDDWSSKSVMMHYYNDGDTGYKRIGHFDQHGTYRCIFFIADWSKL